MQKWDLSFTDSGMEQAFSRRYNKELLHLDATHCVLHVVSNTAAIIWLLLNNTAAASVWQFLATGAQSSSKHCCACFK